VVDRVSDGGTRHEQVASQLVHRFGVLRRAPTRLPAEVTELDPLPSQLTGSDAWVVLLGLRRQVWALPARRQFCLLDRSIEGGVAAVCSSARQVLQHGIMSTVLEDPAKGQSAKRSVFGLVPDQAKRVRIHTPGYPTATRPVERNVFVLTDHIPQPPETIELLKTRSAPTNPPR
jgi:hypothetical protein